eukprot:CAMPEP_0194302818 /NCGR_PEP_ID=MMETSP0171-20130528/681_1 /TAXON_ID=218684 /ORGANISM="Corethron pennatum, Strain L29A3" /LENGTH=387 /DNA_ID=CAMNT_0039053451 /DNA_START=44 /DNA_END=1207 /DNA_ORIENTATION=+
MTFDDRTADFFGIATSLQQQLQGSPSSPQSAAAAVAHTSNEKPLPPDAYRDLRSFHDRVGVISQMVSETSGDLKELSTLVSRGGGRLFTVGEEASRMDGLVLGIKSSIEELNTRLDDANSYLQSRKRAMGGPSSHAVQSATNLVGQLHEDFASATAGFKKVLQKRSDGMKERNDRSKEMFGGGGGTAAGAPRIGGPGALALSRPTVYGGALGVGGPPIYEPMNLKTGGTSGTPAGESSDSQSHLPRPDGVLPTFSGSVSSHNRSNRAPPVMTPVQIMRAEQESGQDQMMQLIRNQDYLQERADAMQTVESHIVELGGIFNKLAVMVNEQREMVDRIDENVDDANENINSSLSVLTNTLNSLRSNKMLGVKVFSILIIFIIFFVTFLA